MRCRVDCFPREFTAPYEVRLADGTTVMYTPPFDPFDLPAAHIFKIGADRRSREIEATGFVAPCNSPAGW